MPHVVRVHDLRQLTAASLGPHIAGLAPNIPATNDTESYFYGVQRRVGLLVEADVKLNHRDAREFTRVLLNKNFKPLARSTDYSKVHYLREINQPEHRKEELRKAIRPRNYFWRHQHLCNCKGFTKMESLDRKPREKAEQMPPPRGINSRSDSFKIETGPYFHRIERQMFSSKYFIKYVPVRERMAWLIQRLQRPGSVYLATDFTAFESHMTPQVMRTFEFQLYEYMLKFAPDHSSIMRLIRKIGDTNTVYSKFGRFKVDGVRMSGDMCTSLGNGFTNMALMFYVLHSRGIPVSDIDGVFEGDDGLIRVPLQYRALLPTESDFKELGCHIKLNVCKDVATSEFCGVVCHEKVGHNIIDAYSALVKTGWTTSSQKYGRVGKLKGLLRAKAFSLCYEAPNCPITRAFADALLRLTSDSSVVYENNVMSWWDQQVLLGVSLDKLPPPAVIHPLSRDVMVEKFGVSISTQLQYEAYFARMTDIRPVPNFFANDLVADSHRENYRRNAVYVAANVPYKIYVQ